MDAQRRWVSLSGSKGDGSVDQRDGGSADTLAKPDGDTEAGSTRNMRSNVDGKMEWTVGKTEEKGEEGLL